MNVVLIACGPSKDKVMWAGPDVDWGNYALVNDAFFEWQGPKKFWFSLHPDKFFKPEYVGQVRMIGGGDKKGSTKHYEFIQGYRYEGTSSLFAVRWLIECANYDKVIMYGVDLDGDYVCERHHWYPFLDKHRDKIIDHSDTQWI